MVEFLAQQPVLLSQAGIVGLQRSDTRTQLFDFLEQRGVGHTTLTGIQTDCSNLQEKSSPSIPTGFGVYFQSVNECAELFAAQTDLTVVVHRPRESSSTQPFGTFPSTGSIP